ncbi:MAG: hypothetical protein ABI240_08100 [Sphingomonas sp.]
MNPPRPAAIGKAAIVAVAVALMTLGACQVRPGAVEANSTLGTEATLNDVVLNTASIVDASGDNCRTPAGGVWARQCGVTKLPLESVPAYNFDRMAALRFGEEAPAILEAVAVYNREAAAVQNATPREFAGALARSADKVRQQVVSVCMIEARRLRGRDDEITAHLFALYAWIRFRQSLVDGASAVALEWDDVSGLPCFQRTRDFFLGERPGFLTAPRGSTYRLPIHFAHALAAHFHARGQDTLADALWYRAELDQADDRKFACAAGPLVEGYPSMHSAEPDLWEACAANAVAGKSCLKTLEPCGGLRVPPPWGAEK